jgi:hypothetical protein
MALSIYSKGRTGSAECRPCPAASCQASERWSRGPRPRISQQSVGDGVRQGKVQPPTRESCACVASGWLTEATAGLAGNRQQIARGHVVHLPWVASSVLPVYRVHAGASFKMFHKRRSGLVFVFVTHVQLSLITVTKCTFCFTNDCNFVTVHAHTTIQL